MRLVLRVLAALVLMYLWPAAAPRTLLRLSLVESAEAQEGAKVWVNTRSGVYHCPGSRYYGNTKAGEFSSEVEAIGAGNRPAYGQSCGAVAAPASSPPGVNLVAPASKDREASQVWVNTASGVYHCPGTRYYGNTKRGTYMSEPEARNAGHRPAYGRTCGG